MTEWDTLEACPGYIEVEWSANRNHEGADDGPGHGSVAGGLHGNVVRRFPRYCLEHVCSRDHGRPPWVGKDQQKSLSSSKPIDVHAEDEV